MFVNHFRRFVIPLSAIFLSVLFFALIPALFMRLSTVTHTYVAENAPTTDVAIVLGASVVRGAPSPVLAARADEAIVLYRGGKVSKILVSGDSGTLSHDEVTPVREYLLAAGIPSEDIFLDHAGFDTYSSMYRAHSVFEVQSVTVVTQDFHMPRSLWIARHIGLPAHGVVAGNRGSIYDYAREIPASIKAFVDTSVGRKPKYLGPPIPLSGDGEKTWD